MHKIHKYIKIYVYFNVKLKVHDWKCYLISWHIFTRRTSFYLCCDLFSPNKCELATGVFHCNVSFKFFFFNVMAQMMACFDRKMSGNECHCHRCYCFFFLLFFLTHLHVLWFSQRRLCVQSCCCVPVCEMSVSFAVSAPLKLQQETFVKHTHQEAKKRWMNMGGEINNWIHNIDILC